jgi:hypothetical protein
MSGRLPGDMWAGSLEQVVECLWVLREPRTVRTQAVLGPGLAFWGFYGGRGNWRSARGLDDLGVVLGLIDLVLDTELVAGSTDDGKGDDSPADGGEGEGLWDFVGCRHGYLHYDYLFLSDGLGREGGQPILRPGPGVLALLTEPAYAVVSPTQPIRVVCVLCS